MRRLVAAFLAVIALTGAVYLGFARLDTDYFISGSRCRYMAPHPCGGLVPAQVPPAHYRGSWQIPGAILIGALGVAEGLALLRRRPSVLLG